MMHNFEFNISPFFIENLVAVIQRVAATLENKIVVSMDDIEEDPDLAVAWRAGLLESLQEDCKVLLSLITGDDFRSGVVAIDEAHADAMLRACSAVRLKIQQTFLQDEVSDEALETGTIDFHKLQPDTQKVFACYVFLANWQELLLAKLMPDMDGGTY